jgi:hypothetical protein
MSTGEVGVIYNKVDTIDLVNRNDSIYLHKGVGGRCTG